MTTISDILNTTPLNTSGAQLFSIAKYVSPDPGLAPAYEGLRNDHFLEDSIEYRKFHTARIYAELFKGMDGIQACAQFSDINYQIVIDMANKLKILNKTCGINEFFNKHGLAAIVTGGTGAKTMALHSDIDIILVTMDAAKLHETEGEFREGLIDFKTLCWDTFPKLGLKSVGITYYTPDYLAEDLPSRAQLECATSLLSGEYIFGDKSVYEQFALRLKEEVTRFRDPFIDNILDELDKRHKHFGNSTHDRMLDLKDSPGFLRDLDFIRYIITIVKCSEGEAAAEMLLTTQERKEIRDAASIFLQLKYFAQHDLPPGIDAGGERLNTLTYNRIASVFQSFADIVSPLQDNGCNAYEMLFRQSENVLEKLSKVIDSTRRKTFDRESSIYYSLNAAISEDKSALELVRLGLKAISALASQYNIIECGSCVWKYPLEVRKTLALIKGIQESAGAEVFDSEINRDEFLKIIADGSATNGGIRMLDYCGLLSRFLPCFAELKRFSKIENYQKTSHDEHSILAIEALNSLFSGILPGTNDFYEKFLYLKNNPKLILSVLLHDVGSRQETRVRPHEVIGAEMVLKNLKDETISNLVRLHSMLPKLSDSFEATSVSALENAAESIGSKETLDMLFLLSWVDKFTSNNQTFTPEKQRRLLRLYNSLNKIFDAGSGQAEEIPPLTHVAEHLEKLPLKYRLECDASTIAEHVRLLDNLSSDFQISWIPAQEQAIPVLDLAFVGKDKPGLFRDIAYVLCEKNLEITEARIFTRSDGFACNSFSLRCGRNNSLIHTHEDRKEELLKSITEKLETLTLDRKRLPDNYSDEVDFETGLHVYFTGASELCVECRDRRGLAYLIGDSLTNLGVSITSAKLFTGNRCIRNLFRIENIDNSPIGEEKRALVERTLTAALSGAAYLQ